MYSLVAILLAAAQHSPPIKEPMGFGQHYLQALKGEAIGTGTGLAFGLAGMWITKEPGSLVLVPIGNTLGTAMGANLATESDEQNGSLLASLVGTVLGGVAIGGAMNQAGEAVSSDEGTSSLAVGMGLVGWSLGAPLVATASQRLFTTSSAPLVSLWSPSGRPHEAVGLRMQWRLP